MFRLPFLDWYEHFIEKDEMAFVCLASNPGICTFTSFSFSLAHLSTSFSSAGQ
jgi:hypothetical protein